MNRRTYLVGAQMSDKLSNRQLLNLMTGIMAKYYVGCEYPGEVPHSTKLRAKDSMVRQL